MALAILRHEPLVRARLILSPPTDGILIMEGRHLPFPYPAYIIFRAEK